MYNLLIVDDEPYILYSLEDMFRQQRDLELDICSAKSADEALARMRGTRIDIVISDIRMPGMDGLALMREIRRRWPRSKVILLTAYPDFAYAQQTVRSGGFDYLLKSDDPSLILSAVRKAIAELDAAWEIEELMRQSSDMLHESLPVLQKEYLLRLVRGGETDGAWRSRRFRGLGLPLDAERPCLLVAGRVDDWGKYADAGSRELMIYAIQNIAQDILTEADTLQVFVDEYKFVWMIQAKDRRAEAPAADADFAGYVHGCVDAIPSACFRVLGIPLSLVVGTRPIEWNRMPSEFTEMSRRLFGHPGHGGDRRMLLFDGEQAPLAVPEPTKKQFIHQKLQLIPALENSLETGTREEFRRLFAEIAGGMDDLPYAYGLTLYHALCSVLLACMHKWDLPTGARGEEMPDPDLFAGFDKLQSWTMAERRFLSVGDKLFDLRQEEHNVAAREIVRSVQRFVEDNLARDLSLTRLSAVVHLSPDYLCRFYKQKTGEGLSDYITRVRLTKAKELLAQTDLKAQDVAERVGIGSPQYFSRLFKKYTKLTPQEYRSAALEGKAE